MLALSLASCGSEAPLPPKPAVVEVTMREHRFAFDRPVPRGRVVFEARNAGRGPHSLAILRLPEDLPPLEAELRSKERRIVPTLVSIKPRRPGATGTFAVDLTPGRYAMICSVEGRNGRPHFRDGMHSEFRVG